MITERKYQICTTCIMDTSDENIVFDSKGNCNYCASHDLKPVLDDKTKKQMFDETIAEIKKQGKGKKYDCISGVSGGVDSSYLTYLLKDAGLRVLLVHLDNGWNSELAVNNIENIIAHLGFDLYTKVLDWDEFRALQLAYLNASVLDLEALSDHAIFATLFKVAAKNNIKYIVTGGNDATESILPLSWRYEPKTLDDVNISSIYKQFTGKKLKDFPLMSFREYLYYKKMKRIEVVSPLNYVVYNKDEAKKTIMENLGWKDYGGKHYESIITRFYQGYILPNKFGIDKRRAHLSTLIVNGQMTREEALEIIRTPPLEENILKQDLEYVPKKLGITPEAFQQIMDMDPVSHLHYPNNTKLRDNYEKGMKIIKKITKR